MPFLTVFPAEAMDRLIDHLTGARPQTLRNIVEDTEDLLSYASGRIFDGAPAPVNVTASPETVASLGKAEQVALLGRIRAECCSGEQTAQTVGTFPGWQTAVQLFIAILQELLKQYPS